MRALSTTLLLSTTLFVCFALTIGLTWAPCYSQTCTEHYHPLATRIHIVVYYALLASIGLGLLVRAYSLKCRALSKHHLTRRELPILRKRISVGGLLFGIWVVGIVLATTGLWAMPIVHYWTAKLHPVGWDHQLVRLVATTVNAHHADILLGLLLIPVGRNSLLGRSFVLHQHTLLYAHKLLAYLMVLAVLSHAIPYFFFVAFYVTIPYNPRTDPGKFEIWVENPNISLYQLKKLGGYYTAVLFTGTVSLLLMLIIVITAIPVVRRRAYNVFYYFHIVLSVLIFLGTCIHASTNFYFLLPGLVLWMLDWAWRLFRGDGGLTQGLDGTLGDAGNGWYRITLPPNVEGHPFGSPSDRDSGASTEKQTMARPMQTYYLNVPSVSKLQTHAFNAATIGSADSGPTFLFQRPSIEGKRKSKRAQKQWSWKVSGKAHSEHDTETTQPSRIRIRAEGPYVPPETSYEAAQRVICVVGGTGITGALSLAEWFLNHRLQDSNASFTIIWTVRSASTALLPDWQDLVARSAGTGGKLRLQSHVSSENGRLDLDAAIRKQLVDEREGSEGTAWVYISGPAGLLTAAEDVCCDVEAELRTARKSGVRSGLGVQSLSQFVAKWDV